MITELSSIEVRGLHVEIRRKNIANLHLGVYPPEGKVRVSSPLSVSDEAIRLAVISKWSWIRRQQENFAGQLRLTQREVVSGESHYVFGQRYLLRVVATTGPQSVNLVNKSTIEMRVRKSATEVQRQAILERWHRALLREALEPIVEKWQERIGVKAAFWGIKRMKTKWGSCNPDTQRIWINSELAKKNLECLEMLVVHELVHILVPNHDDRFTAKMDEYLPDWRSRQRTLNASPLAFERWDY
jgi:predicted metal-dependent hydrolase